MEESNFEWHEVPDEHWEDWNNMQRESKKNKDLLDLSAPCPVCKTKNVHQWYMVGKKLMDEVFDGVRYVARGALWVWCSNCGCCQHYSASVPEWWNCDLLVDKSKLTISPELIEEARLNRQNEMQK
jgi:hypothetical protein